MGRTRPATVKLMHMTGVNVSVSVVSQATDLRRFETADNYRYAPSCSRESGLHFNRPERAPDSGIHRESGTIKTPGVESCPWISFRRVGAILKRQQRDYLPDVKILNAPLGFSSSLTRRYLRPPLIHGHTREIWIPMRYQRSRSVQSRPFGEGRTFQKKNGCPAPSILHEVLDTFCGNEAN